MRREGSIGRAARRVAAAVIVAVAPACAPVPWNAPPARAPVPAPTPAPAPAPPPTTARQPQPVAGHLRPGDAVRVRIWREPDLSGEFAVDETGAVVFPKIGRRLVVGVPPDRLQRDLVAAYDRFLLNPSIEVVVLRRVNVLGAVTRPGLYLVDPTMTVADALALAGGATPAARPGRVELVRDGGRVRTPVDVRARVTDSVIRSGDQLYVPERSWLVQNASAVSIGVSALLGVVSILAGR